MAFTERDLEAQRAAFASLKKEFAHLQEKADLLKKEHNFQEADRIDLNNLTPAQQKMREYAESEAYKQGEMRITQAKLATKPTKSGSGRKNIIRM